MSEVDSMWFRLQYLKDDEDDFEEILVNFCGLISFLASVVEHKLLKIYKVGGFVKCDDTIKLSD